MVQQAQADGRSRSAISDEEQRLREQILFGARWLPREIGDIFGHVTVRLPASSGRAGFMMKHLRVPPKPIDPDEIMVWDPDGNLLEGTQDRPKEVPLYTSIYRARPDVQSIVHIHPPVATALTMAGKTVFPINQTSQRFQGPLKVFRGNLIGDDQIGGELAEALGDSRAIMLQGHGAVIVGDNVPCAVVSAHYLEMAAKMQVWAGSVGTPQMLPPELIAENEVANFLWRYQEWLEESRRAR
jgi:ribulose-5-phosphate 4-epimerase/fuculose-1-phosphate aldolase